MAVGEDVADRDGRDGACKGLALSVADNNTDGCCEALLDGDGVNVLLTGATSAGAGYLHVMICKTPSPSIYDVAEKFADVHVVE